MTLHWLQFALEKLRSVMVLFSFPQLHPRGIHSVLLLQVQNLDDNRYVEFGTQYFQWGISTFTARKSLNTEST